MAMKQEKRNKFDFYYLIKTYPNLDIFCRLNDWAKL